MGVHSPQMASHGSSWATLASTLRNLSQLLPGQTDPSGESDLYFRRACLAAAEERYDVALVFCTKAVEVSPRHLAARLLLARIHDLGLGNLEAAVAGYRKVIALAGYDGADPHCLAAREALDALVQRTDALAVSR
jgi:tetratricopeptide (TPR) repeat protein